MVGASSRLFILLTTPLNLFHHRPSHLLRLARSHSHSLTSPLSPLSTRILSLSPTNSIFVIKSSRNFHAQTTCNALPENNHIPADNYLVPPSHPWPEWSRLLEYLSVAGYFNGNINIEDEFVANESLSMEFVAAARACLAFARDRPDILGSLPINVIQVLIDDGTPFLFKSATETERRMRSFLQAEESKEAGTVDLMKYVLSYASNPIINPERNINESTESAVRKLIQDMANLSGTGPASQMYPTQQFQAVGRREQTSRNLGPNITMKRGDWICPKCSFMNFARNTKCLECEELRPQRQLNGEWDCPQCNFFNYRENVVCLKCECRRPGEAPFLKSVGQAKASSDRQSISSHYRNDYGDNGTPDGNNFRGTNKNLETSVNGENTKKEGRPHIPKGSNSSYVPFVPLPADMFAKKPEKMTNEHSEATSMRSAEFSSWNDDSEKSATKVQSKQNKDVDEEDKSDRWFKKVAELHDVPDLTTAISDEDFPQIMPMRKGENRFVVSKKKDRSLNSPTYKRQQAMEQGSNINFVPFVPFPPDYFAKKDNQQQPASTDSTVKPTNNTSETSNNTTRDMNLVQETRNHQMGNANNLDSKPSIGNRDSLSQQTPEIQNETRPKILNVGQQTEESQNVRSGWTGKSLEGSAVKETDPLDMSEEAKAERWFRRVAQIKDISELSQIPDEDFPSIMPMRKGVNRFVVSKRKTPLERRLTSPQYRKNLRIMSSDPMKKEGDDS